MKTTINTRDDIEKTLDIEKVQWFKNGDHPRDRVGEREIDIMVLLDQHPGLIDSPEYPVHIPDNAPTYERLEGAIVRFYRHPDINGTTRHCDLAYIQRPECEYTMHDHGWIDIPDGGITVCPGDWIITDGRDARRDPVTWAIVIRPNTP